MSLVAAGLMVGDPVERTGHALSVELGPGKSSLSGHRLEFLLRQVL